ncbi:MAG: hypothetical protein A2087_10795 [Spirochaetes bacterium GWD1_61_31]|nr:MAG: hypothetical protein A2Y37_09530 [Spirochaetes bacterium GWB1_60_80]OHD28513.1 MAG: hypothetical protein A2004_02590 [Spirochaetes bacterium GWC1_61_12]OHD35255.1 MAG: hypothetical protein A2087_10795 [Spirochaetes bacterium GWD1_61_31]OHD41447.1 MAG: hypothetical protein A2Y35_05835 [Spirochaetes bacterium GWE1_60_18]OHD61350.1 MAG: hypothetical protein A2Y32_04225 [Spirochaetes bacterium GWF1_60_12]HAP43348.1 hypothetical protein [Spirochaetaceae bacterium]
MALKATIYAAELEVVDLDRQHFATYQLKLARHPSETEERLMVRLLVYALQAHPRLAFGGGVSESGEPDLWQKDLTGDIERWVELGHPDERVLTKACGRARQVLVYTYSQFPERWYEPIRKRLAGLRNLALWSITDQEAAALGSLARRKLTVQCAVQDGVVWLRDDEGGAVEVVPQRLEL